ncbi:MAG: hypothetical protein Fues2KO_40120 [Fuerstiella sp.]
MSLRLIDVSFAGTTMSFARLGWAYRLLNRLAGLRFFLVIDGSGEPNFLIAVGCGTRRNSAEKSVVDAKAQTAGWALKRCGHIW